MQEIGDRRPGRSDPGVDEDPALIGQDEVAVIVRTPHVQRSPRVAVRRNDLGPFVPRYVGERLRQGPRTLPDVVAQRDDLDLADPDAPVLHSRYSPSERAITTRWISLVPSTMRSIRTIRKMRSTGPSESSPIPPKICTARSATRFTISVLWSFTMLDSLIGAWPSSTSHARW